MSRSAEDLAQEVGALRYENQKYADTTRELREELAKAEKELAWWKKTFGPEADK